MPRKRRYLDEGNYSIQGSPAQHYNVAGQIMNSLNPYTAIMNASRSGNEYVKNLEAADRLAKYANYSIAPITIMAAPAESEAVFTDILLGNNYAAALAGNALTPALRYIHNSIKDNTKNKTEQIDHKHDTTRRHYNLGGNKGYNRHSLKHGGIYIKPSHRGRFTALKERTGHSTTWFKENGTPAQKKMATFELNAAKWKH